MPFVSFAAPWFLALAPASLLVLFAVRRRASERPRAAADFELWRRAAVRLGVPPRRRAFSPRDATALLPLVLLACALAGPTIAFEGAPAPVALVLDRSSSMGATVDGRTRVARARARAAATLGGRDVEAFPIPPSDASDDSAAADAVDPARLVALSAALRAGGRDVVVATDRDVRTPPGVGLAAVRDDAPNAGIVAATRGGDGALLVRVVGDEGGAPRTLRLFGKAGEPLGETALGDPRAARVVVPPEVAARVMRVALEPADANPRDDVVRFASAPRRARVACVGVGGALRRALRAQPELDVVVGPAADADMTVLSGPRPPGSAGVVWLVPPFTGDPDFTVGAPGEVAGPVRGAGPCAGFSGDDVRFERVDLGGRRPANAVAVLVVGDRPLVERAGGTTAWRFDPDGSAWARTASFPLAVRALLAADGLLGLAGPTAVEGPFAREEILDDFGPAPPDRAPNFAAAPGTAIEAGPALATLAAAIALAAAFLPAILRRKARAGSAFGARARPAD